jgi:hypothetical protein
MDGSEIPQERRTLKLRGLDCVLRYEVPAAHADPYDAGTLYVERGRLSDAVREFDEDIRLDPRRARFTA